MIRKQLFKALKEISNCSLYKVIMKLIFFKFVKNNFFNNNAVKVWKFVVIVFTVYYAILLFLIQFKINHKLFNLYTHFRFKFVIKCFLYYNLENIDNDWFILLKLCCINPKIRWYSFSIFLSFRFKFEINHNFV